MKTLGCSLLCLAISATCAEKTSLILDPGPIEGLDLAGGPGGAANAPKAPFTFVKKEARGITEKVVVTDARQKKWMVKFGDEAKAENFASRISWAAGYPVRASYYVANGQISGMAEPFYAARFQMFDTDSFKEVQSGKLDLNNRREDQRELNGLKLLALLVANWDVKPANTGIFSIDGRQFAMISDWGASMGDPASPNVPERKWNCQAYDRRTDTLMNGVSNGYVQFNYTQYAARHEHALADGIKIEDLKWFLGRLGKLSDGQVRAALVASGASPAEADCFGRAFRRRLTAFSAAAQGGSTAAPSGKTVTKTTTTTTTTTTVDK